MIFFCVIMAVFALYRTVLSAEVKFILQVDVDAEAPLFLSYNLSNMQTEDTLVQVENSAERAASSLYSLSEQFCQSHALDVRLTENCADTIDNAAAHHAWDTVESRLDEMLSAKLNVVSPNSSPTSASSLTTSNESCPLGRMAVVSAIFCGYDSVKPVLFRQPCTDYYLFTDHHIPVTPATELYPWNIIHATDHLNYLDGNSLDSSTTTEAPPVEWDVLDLYRSVDDYTKFPPRRCSKALSSLRNSLANPTLSYSKRCMMSAKYYRMQGMKLPMFQPTAASTCAVDASDPECNSTADGNSSMNREQTAAPYTYFLWLDGSRRLGSATLYDDVVKIMTTTDETDSNISHTKLSTVDMVYFRHPFSRAVGQEVEESMKQPRYATDGLLEQYGHYVARGLPKTAKVMDTSAFVFRLQSHAAWHVLEAWWLHCLSYTVQDQVSLAYVMWNLGPVARMTVVTRLAMSYMIGPRPPTKPHDLNKH